MRTIGITLAACLAVLAAGGAMSAERMPGNTAAGGVPSSGGNVLATSGGAINAANQAVPVSGGFSPLTAAECKGLGGKVVANITCGLSGSAYSCVTVDSDGVVRKACLTK